MALRHQGSQLPLSISIPFDFESKVQGLAVSGGEGRATHGASELLEVRQKGAL